MVAAVVVVAWWFYCGRVDGCYDDGGDAGDDDGCFGDKKLGPFLLLLLLLLMMLLMMVPLARGRNRALHGDEASLGDASGHALPDYPL